MLSVKKEKHTTEKLSRVQNIVEFGNNNFRELPISRYFAGNSLILKYFAVNFCE